MPSCTITKSGRFDEYGRPLTVGVTYTGTLDQCRSLVQSGFATMSAADLDDGSTGGLAQPSLVAPQLTVTQALQTPVSGATIYPAVVANDPTAAGANWAAITAAIAGGYQIEVGARTEGPVWVDKTVMTRSRRTLRVADGNSLKLADGVSANLVRNIEAQNTLAAAKFNHSVAGVCTVTEAGHSRSAGDVVYINGLGGDGALLGAQTITSASGNQWTFSAAGTGTPTGWGYVGIYSPLAGSAFVRGATATGTGTISSSTLTITTQGSATPFVEGMTVTGTGLSGQELAGPMGATETGNGTQWSMSSAGTNGSGIAITGALPASWVLVSEPGHAKLVGDQVYIDGIVSTGGGINGARRVMAVMADWWAFESSNSTAETCSGIAQVLHAHSISLSGSFDGNYRNQTPGYNESHGVVLGNVSRHDVVGARVKDCFKYSIWTFNSGAGGSYRGIKFDSRSDGIHFEAPWNSPNISDVHGRQEDDVVSFTNNSLTSTWPGLSSPSGQGAGIGCTTISHVKATNSKTNSIIKIAGDTSSGYRVGSFDIRQISGRANQGVYINSGIVGTGTSGDRLVIDGVVMDGIMGNPVAVKLNAGSGYGFDEVSIAGVPVLGAQGPYSIYCQSGTYRTIRVRTESVNISGAVSYWQSDAAVIGLLDLDLGTVLTTAAAAKVCNLNGSTITDLIVSGRFVGTSSNGWAIYQFGGSLSRLFVRESSSDLLNQFFAQSNTAYAQALEIFVNGLRCAAGGSLFVTYGAASVYADGMTYNGSAGGFVLAPQSTSTSRIVLGAGCDVASGRAIRNASGTVNSASGLGIKLDIGASGATTPTGMTPLAGDVVLNTNATGPGLYQYKSGAWAAL